VQTFLCKRCVDTPINGVDTTTQIPRQNVDTLSEQVDTRRSSHNSQFEELGQQVDTLPEQVDTGPSSQNSIFHNLDSVSTPPPGQVDTLREVFILKWNGATCQPRPMGINLGSRALIPKRYLWTLLGIKGPLLALHPRKRDPTASQSLLKVPWRLQEVVSLLCSPVLPEDQFSPIQNPQKHSKEANPVEAFVGEEFKEDPKTPKCRASALDFKIASYFPIQASTREYT
ncbi:hypothetical protein Taro_056235, partial [Colocasia esculenta]|nr:hypothetical protein [Colocasia esculenta]